MNREDEIKLITTYLKTKEIGRLQELEIIITVLKANLNELVTEINKVTNFADGSYTGDIRKVGDELQKYTGEYYDLTTVINNR